MSETKTTTASPSGPSVLPYFEGKVYGFGRAFAWVLGGKWWIFTAEEIGQLMGGN